MDKYKGDIHMPECLVDLSFNSRVILVLKLQASEQFEKLAWIVIYILHIYLFGLEMLIHTRDAQFQNKKKPRIILELKLKSTKHLGT